jgi:hypothetical protein
MVLAYTSRLIYSHILLQNLKIEQSHFCDNIISASILLRNAIVGLLWDLALDGIA